MVEEINEATATKKKGVCQKVYVDADGTTETRSATPTSDQLQFRFANGDTHTVKQSDHNAEIKFCLEWFGISEKYGNAYAGAKGNAGDAAESFLSMQEQLKGGTWVERAEGLGPRPTLIADAIVAALIESKQEVDDDRKAAILAKVTDKDTGKAVREGALKDPAIKAQFEKAKAARAAERAAVAAKAAKGLVVTAEGF